MWILVIQIPAFSSVSYECGHAQGKRGSNYHAHYFVNGHWTDCLATAIHSRYNTYLHSAGVTLQQQKKSRCVRALVKLTHRLVCTKPRRKTPHATVWKASRTTERFLKDMLSYIDWK